MYAIPSIRYLSHKVKNDEHFRALVTHIVDEYALLRRSNLRNMHMTACLSFLDGSHTPVEELQLSLRLYPKGRERSAASTVALDGPMRDYAWLYVFSNLRKRNYTLRTLTEDAAIMGADHPPLRFEI